jgi:TRAP-type C4-dicarboxylate transport system substrate-binding protein
MLKKNILCKAVIVLFAMAFASGITACGGSSSSSTAPPADSEATADSAAAPADDGKVYEFNFTHQDPATTRMAPVFDQWCKDLEANSNGRVKVTMYYGGTLAGPNEAVNMVEQGSVDMCWNANGHNPGRFDISEIMTLPYNGVDNPVLGTIVLNELYSEVPEIQDEWSKIDARVVALFQNANQPISTRDVKIDDPKKFDGLRIRTATPAVIALLKELGASPMSFAITDSYENISKNVADGLVNDWHNLDAQNLWEVVKYTLDINAGPAFGFVLINHDSYNSMPPDLQKIFDDTSANLAFDLAEVMADCLPLYKEKAVAQGNCDIYKPNDEIDAFLRASADNVISDWVTTISDTKGVDGEALMVLQQEKLDKYRAQYANYSYEE